MNRLVAGLRKEDLGRKSMTRNPLLFSLMQRMHLVEKAGSGFKWIHEAMVEYGFGDPLIEANEYWFSVTFKRPSKVTEKVTENQLKIRALMKKTPSISSTEIAEKIGISVRKTKENIKNLNK